MSVDWERVGDTAVTYAVIDAAPTNFRISRTRICMFLRWLVLGTPPPGSFQVEIGGGKLNSTNTQSNRVHGLGKQVSRLHYAAIPKQWCATRYWIYYNLNRSIGRKPKAGKDWTLEEIETALERLPAILDHFIAQYQQRYSRSW